MITPPLATPTPAANPTAPSDRLHIDFVDSLRGLAALYVAIHHIVFYFWPPWGNPPRNFTVRIANEFFYFGRYAVAVFIVLSGFCLALPAVKNGRMRHTFWEFIRRRARRILPPYYAALILSLAFIAATGTAPSETIWDDSVKLTQVGVIANLLAVQNWFGASAFGQINYVFWSVAVEWHIYFLFPVILWLWSRTGSKMLATGLILVAAVALSWVCKDNRWAYLNIQFVGLFSLGMFAASLALKKTSGLALRAGTLTVSLIGLTVLTACSARLGWMQASQVWPLLDLVVGITTAAFLVYLVHSPASLVRRGLCFRPLVGVGIISYSIYLVHAPVIQAVWLFAKKVLHLSFFPTLWFMLGVAVPLIVVVAYVFHLGFEKPFLNSPTDSKTDRNAAT